MANECGVVRQTVYNCIKAAEMSGVTTQAPQDLGVNMATDAWISKTWHPALNGIVRSANTLDSSKRDSLVRWLRAVAMAVKRGDKIAPNLEQVAGG